MFSDIILTKCIKECIDSGTKNFAIYPCGDNGLRINELLITNFDIRNQVLIDNYKAESDNRYINIYEFKKTYNDSVKIFITVENSILNDKMYKELIGFVPKENIINLLDYNKNAFFEIKKILTSALSLENFLPNYQKNNYINSNTENKVRIRIVHGHYPTWNVIKPICDEILKDDTFDLKLIIGWTKEQKCIEQAQNNNIPYEIWDEYDANFDKPDILIVTHPYDYVTQIPDLHKYVKLVIVASVLLIRNTSSLELFWKVHENGFMRFRPDYYLCDSLLYNDIVNTNTFPLDIIEIGNAKYDGIYKACNKKEFPDKWNKIKNKKIFLWTTDHGLYKQKITGVTFDLYAKEIFKYIVNNDNIGLIFRPHPVFIKELINTGCWTTSDVLDLKKWCNESSNIIYDDSETYDNAYSVADAIIADAICGITLSSLPTLKPICVTYRSLEDKPFHPEVVKNYYSAYNPQEIVEFFEMVIDNKDPLYEKRLEISKKFVKNFDGNNGLRIKEFIKEKYYEKIRKEKLL